MNEGIDTVKFKLCTTNIPVAEGQKPLTYGDLAILTLNTPAQGWTIAEIRIRSRIMDKIEDTYPDGNANLTTEEVTILKEACASMRWGMIHREIIAYSDYIESLI